MRAGAFVAGSARQVVFQIAELLIGGRQTRIDEDAISADIAAALLFVIAERTADAYEASRLIVAPPPPGVRQQLALSIRQLARGRLARLADLDLEGYRPREVELTAGDASDLLYFRILEGLSLTAKDCLGRLGEPGLEQAQALFRQVKELAVVVQPDEQIPGMDRRARSASVLAGPHHLAGLLERAVGTLQTAAVVRIPTPGGVHERWRNWLLAEAERLPFIWENHQRAVATGYLDVGHSLVMTSPTGSGKTTLATLKIAATLCTGKTVVYLAPTHALVSQVERDLNARIGGLAQATSVEEALLEEIGQQLPDLAVLTPERCFALLTFAPELFRRVGLLVFDECHLLGVPRSTREGQAVGSFDRRSIDAMLCLLSFASINKESDYLLLSAMISNGADIADWLQTITGRGCIPFDDKWKPTRQLKACVIYDVKEMQQVALKLSDDFVQWAKPPKVAPASVKALALGTPMGLFSTGMGWNPGAHESLAFRELATGPLPFGVARRPSGWRLTANRNEVAAELAARFAASGLKTIVFCESAPTTGAVARRVNARLPQFPPERDKSQTAWRKKALEEVGAEAALYDAGGMPAAVHHGELLPEERLLAESLFKDRSSQVKVLAATSTLAQGLNLPCDVVILAGTDRIDESDPEETRRTDLLPHEILNALGRAGRAGLAAAGLAVVVPADPIVCDTDAKTVTTGSLLSVVFAEGDQCVPLTDPIASLYDHIVVYGTGKDEAAYFMKRLALSLGAERDGVETFDKFTRRSFGYFLKARGNLAAAEQWITERRQRLEQLIEAAREVSTRDWVTELAAKSGASPGFIAHLADAYGAAPLGSPDAYDWMVWLLNQLPAQDRDFDTFLRPDGVERVFGRGYSQAVEASDRRERARAGILTVLPGWFGSQPLVKLETTIVGFIRAHEGQVKRATPIDPKAKHARRFALRLAPDLSYLAGVLSQVARKLAEEAGSGGVPLAITQSLPQLVRRGFNSPYHLYLDRMMPGLSRRAIEQRFDLAARVIEREPSDDWDTVRHKLDIALLGGMLDDEPDTLLEV
jgi:hypothetical protein